MPSCFCFLFVASSFHIISLKHLKREDVKPSNGWGFVRAMEFHSWDFPRLDATSKSLKCSPWMDVFLGVENGWIMVVVLCKVRTCVLKMPRTWREDTLPK